MGNDVHKVIETALGEVGYLEKTSDRELYNKATNTGDQNYTKYGKEMHTIEPSIMDYLAPWCDAFMSWCFYQAYGIEEAKRLLGGGFDDYTAGSARLYQNIQTWHTGKPQIGDQMFFRSAVRIYYTGLVYSVDSAYVYTVEGDTGGGSRVIADGGGAWKKKYRLGDASVAGYRQPGYGVGNGGSLESSSVPLILAGQIRASNFARCSTGEDGIYGPLSRRTGIKVLQRAMNLGCSARLMEDGLWGPKTQATLGRHYVEYGEIQYMVTALEILLLLESRNLDGVKYPSEFDSSLISAVTQYQTDHGWSPTGVADAPLLHSLTVQKAERDSHGYHTGTT